MLAKQQPEVSELEDVRGWIASSGVREIGGGGEVCRTFQVVNHKVKHKDEDDE